MSNQPKAVSNSPAVTTRRVALVPAADLPAELARLSCLSIGDLKPAWTDTIGGTAPKNARRDYLLRAIAHELQCKIFGGLAKSLHRTLRNLAASEGGKVAASGSRSRSLKTGVRLYREWKGALHEVEVVDDGFRYDGTTFKTLSVIARRITGTRWSGPAFFGVKRDVTGGGNGR